MKICYVAAFAAVPVLPVAQAIAKETNASFDNIETITVIGDEAYRGATLGGAELKDLPLAAHVVNREEIERLRFVDPDEFLDRIPGETQVRNLRIPQGGKSYTVPLVDGMPLASPYRGATQDITTVNSFDIERIEVIKGPASALYANNAFGGVINVITRDAPEDFEGKAWIEFGSFNRRRSGISAAGSSGKFGYFVDANTQNLDGLRDTYKNDRDQLSAKLTFKASEATKFSLRYEHLDRHEIFPGDLRDSEFESDPTVVGRTSGSTDQTKSHSYMFKAEHSLENGKFELGAVRRIEDTIGDGRFSPPRDSSDKSLNVKLLYTHDFGSSQLTIGGEAFDGDVYSEDYGRNDVHLEGPIEVKSDSDVQINALFAQYNLAITEALNLHTGLRHEDITLRTHFDLHASEPLNHGQTFQKDFNNTAPKFGVTYSFNSSISIWGSFSRGYLSPEIGDLFLDRPEANPNLVAEKARHLEFGFKGQLGDLQINSSYYNTRISNFLVTEDDGFVETTTNAGQVTVQGVETVLEFAPSDIWRLSATHTYAHNVFDTYFGADDDGDNDLSGNQLSRSPNHHLNIRAAWLPLDNLTIEAEGDFYSSYFTRDDNSIDPDGKFIRGERINLRVNYAVGPWELWVHALNLTDTLEDRVSYSPPSRRGPGRRNIRIVDGRTIYGGISYKF